MKRSIGFIGGVLAVFLAAYVGTKLVAQTGTPAGTRPSTPQTRIALINLPWVMKHYEKAKSFNDTMKSEGKKFDDQMAALRTQAEAVAKKLQQPGIDNAEKEKLEQEMKRLERDRQDLVEKARKDTGAKANAEVVKIYKEIRTAAWRHAQSAGYDMVLHYTGPTENGDYENPRFVLGNLQSGGCVPLYWNPSLDISANVLAALNAEFKPKP